MPAFDPALLRSAVMRRLAEHPEEQAGPATAGAAEKKGIGIGPYAALAGGSLADGLSTVAALKRPGTVEGNPLLSGGPAELALVKGGGTAALMWALHELAKTGHPTAAKVLGYGAGAVLGGVAAHNTMVGK